MDFAEQIQLEDNRNRFITLLKSITRTGANVEGLIDWLDSSDFYHAPASSRYHSAYEGGLCAHSLNVYDNLKLLNAQKNLGIGEEAMKVAALLHDISKTNYYKKDVRNENFLHLLILL